MSISSCNELCSIKCSSFYWVLILYYIPALISGIDNLSSLRGYAIEVAKCSRCLPEFSITRCERFMVSRIWPVFFQLVLWLSSLTFELCVCKSLTRRWFEPDIWWGGLPWKDVSESSFYQSHCCHHQLDERCWTYDVRVFACSCFLTLCSWLTYPSLFNVKVGWSNGEYSRSIWADKFYQRGLIDWISYGEAIFLCITILLFQYSDGNPI